MRISDWSSDVCSSDLVGSDRRKALREVTEEVVDCRACPRLVAWREQVARERRAAFKDEEYWGRPVPGFGDPDARVMIVGLAPAAHVANRPGRLFTGDRSGDFLSAASHLTDCPTPPPTVHSGDSPPFPHLGVPHRVRYAT